MHEEFIRHKDRKIGWLFKWQTCWRPGFFLRDGKIVEDYASYTPPLREFYEKISYIISFFTRTDRPFKQRMGYLKHYFKELKNKRTNLIKSRWI